MSDTKRHDPIQGEILHEYDGILEADNRLPNWWLATFFGTIAFALVYWGWYEAFHVTPDQSELFATAWMERAGDMGEPNEEMLTTATGDSALVASGRATFEAQCVICHAATGGGLVGPNLTDDAWIHGGAPMAVYNTIRTGVLERGMPAWGEQMAPRTLVGVTAYVLSIRGTNVAGGLPAQGDLGPNDDPNAAPVAPTEGAAGEGEAAPAEGEAAPAEGEAAPTEGAAAPTEGEAVPTEGEAVPTEGEAAPAEGAAAPTEGEAAPAAGAAAEPGPEAAAPAPSDGAAMAHLEH